MQRVEQAGTRLAEPEPPRTGDCLAIPQFTFQASPAWGKQPGQTSRDGRTFAGLERARRTFLSLGNKVSFFRPRDSQKSQTPSHACPPTPTPACLLLPVGVGEGGRPAHRLLFPVQIAPHWVRQPSRGCKSALRGQERRIPPLNSAFRGSWRPCFTSKKQFCAVQGDRRGRIRVWIPAACSLLPNLSLTAQQPEAQAEQCRGMPRSQRDREALAGAVVLQLLRAQDALRWDPGTRE